MIVKLHAPGSREYPPIHKALWLLPGTGQQQFAMHRLHSKNSLSSVRQNRTREDKRRLFEDN
ncbi:hypothetical protein GMD83_00200 [Pseudoflavonifractor sp. BIOML-A7]|jgi:hypothetical protein|nr:hypothetical protein [Pseudoflavonifractor sp. BIOML-A9]MTR44256.1 hypothetical protein [Pseudoflavonifractor sp. BIOML-A13]MTS59011.1 hypothetical protein [Pseudoflavonifractor sp. BIOML-A7]MTS93945.1 hypothetical protein [Pseudoflavonifractor sp. BIOML-A1]